ncbi:MAG: glycosyltransferase family 4 protein [Chthoniobacterales bacterium]|nr:glycosyltransferase family 4 protein [Chthoniobacterales bacterium]
MNLKKILFLSGHAHLGLDPTAEGASGGAELQVALLAKELVQRGKEVVLLAADTGQGDALTQQGIRVRNGGRFDTGTLWDTLRALPRIVSILREEKPDVVAVYGWTSWLYLLANLRAWARYRLLFVCALDSEIDGGFRKTHPWRGSLFQKGMERCDIRLAITEDQVALFRAQGMSCDVMRLLLQEKFSPNRVIDVKNKSIDLLWVARCNRVKQPMLFLDLAAQFPQARCRMICSNQDEELWQAVKRRALTMPHVEFLEKVPYRDIQSHFDQARIFVNTSSDEGVPNTFIHAGLGSTAIASLKVDPDHMFHHFQAGCCAHGDFQLLVEKTRALLANQENLFLAQHQANRFVREWHDNKKNVEIFLESLQPSASSPRSILS